MSKFPKGKAHGLARLLVGIYVQNHPCTESTTWEHM